ncbi:hypothetical protein AKJ16_DCAP12482 [Drosera capensis]
MREPRIRTIKRLLMSAMTNKMDMIVWGHHEVGVHIGFDCVKPCHMITSSLEPSFWPADTGANFHATPDLTDISDAVTYSSPDRLHVGNGEGLDIHRTGRFERENDVLPRSTRRIEAVVAGGEIPKTL